MEKDIFYYKLKVIQSLLDPTIKVGTPSKELFYAFSSDVKLSQEYDEFAEMIRFIRLNDSNAKEVLTEAVVLKCEEVISNPAIASFFFIFNAPLKEMH